MSACCEEIEQELEERTEECRRLTVALDAARSLLEKHGIEIPDEEE